MSCEGLKNCMNSYETEGFKGLPASESPIQEVKKTLQSQGLRVTATGENYLHATASSKIFGFVDDVEFYYDGSELHYRSASRVGRSDLGANAERMRKIIEKINF